MFRFETLEIWQNAILYIKKIYQLTEKFPKPETYSLTSQLRRSAVSIAVNIAEGSASQSKKEFRMFLSYSIRSLAENIAELLIAKEMNFINQDQINILYKEAEILIRRITSFKNILQ
jgi:four helix bundle protein